MKRFVAHVRSSQPRPGFESIRLPGERGFAALEDCRKNGVPLDDAKIQMIRQIAQDNGIAPLS